MDSELQFLALINDKVQTWIKMTGGPIGIAEDIARIIEARMVQLQQQAVKECKLKV
jgi:hypothetical protein